MYIPKHISINRFYSAGYGAKYEPTFATGRYPQSDYRMLSETPVDVDIVLLHFDNTALTIVKGFHQLHVSRVENTTFCGRDRSL